MLPSLFSFPGEGETGLTCATVSLGAGMTTKAELMFVFSPRAHAYSF